MHRSRNNGLSRSGISCFFSALLGRSPASTNGKALCLQAAMNRIFGIVYLTICIGIVSFIGYSCANIIPPTGGPIDSLPPVLIEANPKDSTLNFKGNRIVLTFDEYVDLKDVQNNLLFTPLFETVPIVEVKLKQVTVRIRDTLEPNTTYTFDFGNAITDVNENNPYKYYTYTFSTGPYIDSLQLTGRVWLAENGKVDSTLTIVLHNDLTDSAVVKKRPRYAARVDSTGFFRFKNLPPDSFAIYAIGEAGIMRRYTSPTQYFAFADAPVFSGDTSDIILYAYQEEDKKPTRASTATTGTRTTPAGGVARPNAAAERRLRYSTNLSSSQQDLLTDLVLTFERPLRNFDSTKLLLSTDSTYIPVTGHTISLDTTNKEIHIKNSWKEATQYHLIIDTSFAEDTTNRRLLKNDTLQFTTRKTTDYGTLDIRIRNIDTARNPVLQFVQNDKVVFSVNIKSGHYAQRLFLPGDYDLRILYDRNNNGRWDPGNFFEGRLQPEIAVPILQKITIKPDWDNEFERGL